MIPAHGLSLFAALLFVIVPSMVLASWLKSFLRITLATAGLVSTGINITLFIASICLVGEYDPQWNQPQAPLYVVIQHHLQSDQAPFYLVTLMVTLNLGIALISKLYRAAVLGKITTEEGAVGIAGVRAWLSPLNVLTAVCVAVGTYFLVGYDYMVVAFACIGALLAYPLINTLQDRSAAQPKDADDSLKAPADERQRVLALVEGGKITAEDGAELLTALAQSHAASADAGVPIGSGRQMMFAGAAATLVGFLLPWFSVNLSQALRDATEGTQQSLLQFPGASQSIPDFNSTGALGANSSGGLQQDTMRIGVSGGDLQHGLGWLILAAAFAAAFLPFFWTPRRGSDLQLRNAILASLAVGSVLDLYCLSGSFNAPISIKPGFVLTMAGYGLLWAGAVREYVLHHPRLRPSLAL